MKDNKNDAISLTVKKTTELSDSEQHGMLDLFNMVFKKDRSIEYFRNLFFNTALGYSYHAIMIENDTVIGSFSYMPFYCNINDKKYLAAVSADLMINKKYRGLNHFSNINSAIIDYMRNVGVAFIIDFPNDTSYPIYTKLEFRNVIGDLTTYTLPYRIGGIKSILKIFNRLSILVSNAYISLTSLFASGKVYHFPIEKDMETFNRTRYKQADGKYHIVQSDNGNGFAYKIMDYEGTRAAFLIDVFEKSAKNFNVAVKHIIKNHSNEFDILLYAGRLPFKFHGLIKIPQRFAPKNFHFTGKILIDENGAGDRNADIDKTIDADLFFNINNWDVNLSNYDLL